jgi:hypothetical protein
MTSREVILQAAAALAYEAQRLADQAATIAKYEPMKARPLLERREHYEAIALELRKGAGG